MRRVLKLAALCLALIAGAAAGVAQTPAAETDAAIAERVRALMAELEGYDDVTLDVAAGVVTLDGEAVDPGAVTRLETIVSNMDDVMAVENRVAASTALDKRLNPVAERLGERLRQTLAYLPLLLVASVAAALVIGLGLLVTRGARPWDRLAPNAFIAGIYRQIVRLAFILGGLVLALDILGATALLGTILGAAGLVGLAIGFAVKDTVENFIASVMLSIRQPFRPNDLVLIEGHEGRVIRLTSRATILLDLNGNHVRIPNATVFKGQIVNFVSNPRRRFEFAVGVEAESDLVEVRALMERTLRTLPFVLAEPDISVWLEDITDSGAVFTLSGWIDQRETSIRPARGEALRTVKEAIEAGGFAIPDTTYRIRVAGGGADALASDDGPTDTPETPAEPRCAPAEAVKPRDEEALAVLVTEERSTQDHDLLAESAPKE